MLAAGLSALPVFPAPGFAWPCVGFRWSPPPACKTQVAVRNRVPLQSLPDRFVQRVALPCHALTLGEGMTFPFYSDAFWPASWRILEGLSRESFQRHLSCWCLNVSAPAVLLTFPAGEAEPLLRGLICREKLARPLLQGLAHRKKFAVSQLQGHFRRAGQPRPLLQEPARRKKLPEPQLQEPSCQCFT